MKAKELLVDRALDLSWGPISPEEQREFEEALEWLAIQPPIVRRRPEFAYGLQVLEARRKAARLPLPKRFAAGIASFVAGIWELFSTWALGFGACLALSWLASFWVSTLPEKDQEAFNRAHDRALWWSESQ